MYNQKRRTRRRKPRIIRILLLILLVLAISPVFSHLVRSSSQQLDASQTSRVKNDFDATEAITLDGEIHSAHAILVDLASNKVLFQKASAERIFPASMTKIMTAIVAIENMPNLEDSIVLKEDMFAELNTQNASMAGFKPNEQVKLIDLLYGTMLPSGAEASIGIAEHVFGSQQVFVAAMNQKAKELGMKETHYTNVTGLHDENHYTTAKDMAILLQYAWANDTFKQIFTTKRHSTTPTNLHTTGITFVSTMFQKMRTSEFAGGEILGGKTGYTAEAGLCLASLAVKDAKSYILVTAEAGGNPKSEQYNITDAFRIYGEYLR